MEKKRKEMVSPILSSIYARPLRNIHFKSTPARLQRGMYLANGVLRCFHCHAPADTTRPGYPPFPDRLGGGKLLYKSDSTHLYAPNISPDIETAANIRFAAMLADGNTSAVVQLSANIGRT